jgi:hypothetical protein
VERKQEEERNKKQESKQMKLTDQIAKQFREVYFGGNWTASNLQDKLADVTWQQATTQVDAMHDIATLVYHMNYYVSAVLKVLRGGQLDAKDEYSFDHPPILSQQDWERLLDKTWADAIDLASLVEQFPENKLWEIMEDKKHGNYYRNIHGIIEHNHYHLGQIALIKNIVVQSESNSS